MRLFITLSFLLLSGCDQSAPEHLMQDYIDRVANTLDVNIDADIQVKEEIPLFPRVRERVKPIPETRQGLIEVLDLKYCTGLLQLIAERNSNLGQVMQPSQKMSYEIRFFANISECQNKASSDSSASDDLRKQIEEIYRFKEETLGDEIWNGIFGAEALEANFSRSASPLPAEGPLGFSASREAIQALINISRLSSDNILQYDQTTLSTLETHYKALHHNQFGSRLMHSLVLMTKTMERVSLAINTRLDKRPFCFPGHRTQKHTILQNVFSKYYGQSFQPYLARTHRSGQEWVALQNTLLSQTTPTPSVKKYFTLTFATDNSDSIWQRYNRARDEHTRAWQRLLGQCGLMPGQS